MNFFTTFKIPYSAPFTWLTTLILSTSVTLAETKVINADSFSPAGKSTPKSGADTLAAFRTDSAGLSTSKNQEQGGFLGQKADTSSHVKLDSMHLETRSYALGIFVGLAFGDLEQRRYLTRQISARVAKDSSKILQNVDAVSLAFPIGLQLQIPVFPTLDLLVKTQGIYHRLSGLTGGNGRRSQEDYTVLATTTFAVGARFIIPPTILSVKGHTALQFSYLRHFELGWGSAYGNSGSIDFKVSPYGIGNEFRIGMVEDLGKRFAITGSLGYRVLRFEPDDNDLSWGNLFPGQSGSLNPSINELSLELVGLWCFGL